MVEKKEKDNQKDRVKPEKEREYFELYWMYISGRKMWEVAEAKGISVPTVKNAVAYCRSRMDIIPDNEFVKDTIAKTQRRLSLIETKFKKVYNNDQTSNIIGFSRHITELDEKIMQYKGLIEHNLNLNMNVEGEGMDAILKVIDAALTKLPKEQLEALAKDDDE